MNPFRQKPLPVPENWGLTADADGRLVIGNVPCTDLADMHGTPLHVVDLAGLRRTARAFLRAFNEIYPGPFHAHYAFKCNPVPGIIRYLQAEGFRAEVMSHYELTLARTLGFDDDSIIVNGPFKPRELLEACLVPGVRYVVADSVTELERIESLGAEHERQIPVLLRINPEHIPQGMNKGTATGSRTGCAFGLDLAGGEAARVLAAPFAYRHLLFEGLHFHIGSGMRDPRDYEKALRKLEPLVHVARSAGCPVKVIDIGGGIGVPLSREMTDLEMLGYAAFGYLPSGPGISPIPPFARFAQAVTKGIRHLFPKGDWPELIAEPGRAITGPHQVLLLRVDQVRERPGAGPWAITDGGIGTVTMPTYYEYHEVILGTDVRRPRKARITINGPGCFAADQVYRNKNMPALVSGDVLAVMDSGAYFTSWESNFGFPRPAIVSALEGEVRVLRRRETFSEMWQRDYLSDDDPLPAGPNPTPDAYAFHH